jgi:hypothetical protein
MAHATASLETSLNDDFILNFDDGDAQGKMGGAGSDWHRP